jgi:hypothetical protein
MNENKITRRSVLAKGMAMGAAGALAGSVLNATPAQAWTLAGPLRRDWRFCNKCFSLVRIGLYPYVNNACSAGGLHVVQGWNFQLPYTNSNIRHAGETSEQQSDWMQCSNCSILYYDDFRGPCAGSRYGHDFSGYVTQFLIPHDINPQPANTQNAWRYCFKCSSMYFNGYRPNLGVCPAGWGHAAAGFMFQIPVFSY